MGLFYSILHYTITYYSDVCQHCDATAGYLYLKSKSMLSTTSNQYRKRWFVLHEYILSWYKSNSEVRRSINIGDILFI